MGVSTRGILIFGVASALAVAAGCVAIVETGAGGSWMRNVIAWIAGAGLAMLLARHTPTRGTANAAVVMTTAALTATLFADDVDGVKRWLDIGPLHLNAAALLLPSALVSLGAVGIASVIGLTVTFAAAAILLLQPDASQLTGFAIGALILALRSVLATRWKVLAAGIATIFVTAGWLRPDPLQPVREVEQIFTLCAAVSPLLALLAGASLLAAALAPLAATSPEQVRTRDSALALSAYFVTVSLAPFAGWFPVPLVGLGMSFPVGWWLGIGLLAAMERRSR